MALTKLTSAVMVDGAVSRPAVYSIDVVQKQNVTLPEIEKRIAMLTADLAKWQGIKDQIEADTSGTLDVTSVTPAA